MGAHAHPLLRQVPRRDAGAGHAPQRSLDGAPGVQRPTATVGGQPPRAIAHERLYAVRVAPLLDYTMSMLGAPPAVEKLNASVTECLWRLPHKSLSAAAVSPLWRLGWPLPQDIATRAMRHARAASSRLQETLSDWKRVLWAAREEHGALASLADGSPFAEHEVWADEAVLDKMLRAQGAEASEPWGREAARTIARARRARRLGIPPEAGPAHAAAADALLPRLLRWAWLTGLGREQLREACIRTLASIVGCAPAIPIAVARASGRTPWPQVTAPAARRSRAQHAGAQAAIALRTWFSVPPLARQLRECARSPRRSRCAKPCASTRAQASEVRREMRGVRLPWRSSCSCLVGLSSKRRALARPEGEAAPVLRSASPPALVEWHASKGDFRSVSVTPAVLSKPRHN